ncbi:acyl-homoserine-lactone synthase [uncultured Aliiroseovarius sp.]|uniref:acyl-homoserine-lactone synthase n=1 Tax=uncultured Aliiroseovarius sp. TaxID=1658783 RepID=UPI00262D87BF|nr:acyl-homoserine-lactone synthase [uncultured Aliiroseovarius sp.]
MTNITRIPMSYVCSIVTVPAGRMPASTAEELNNDLFAKYMDLRTRVFTNEKGWDVWLPTKNDLDSYDCFDALYIIAYEPRSNRVLGGARLVCTDRVHKSPRNQSSTYMINDAFKGVLKGLPTNICDSQPPQDENVWELTRLVVGDADPSVARSVLKASNDFLHAQKATKCLFLGPRAFMRMAKGMGYTPVPMGPVVGTPGDSFLAFETEVLPPFEDGSTDLYALTDYISNSFNKVLFNG